MRKPKDREFNARTGANIRFLRKEQGMRVKEMSERLSLNSNYIYMIERGKVDISLALASRIADALDCELDHLVYGVDAIAGEDAGSAHARQAEM